MLNTAEYFVFGANRGVKGIAYTDALDGKHSYPRLPEYGDAEYDSSAFGRLHASALILVATAAPDAHPDIPPEGEPVRQLSICMAYSFCCADLCNAELLSRGLPCCDAL